MFFDSWFIAAYDGANTVQRVLGEVNGAKVRCLAFHSQPRVPTTGETQDQFRQICAPAADIALIRGVSGAM